MRGGSAGEFPPWEPHLQWRGRRLHAGSGAPVQPVNRPRWSVVLGHRGEETSELTSPPTGRSGGLYAATSCVAQLAPPPGMPKRRVTEGLERRWTLSQRRVYRESRTPSAGVSSRGRPVSTGAKTNARSPCGRCRVTVTRSRAALGAGVTSLATASERYGRRTGRGASVPGISARGRE